MAGVLGERGAQGKGFAQGKCLKFWPFPPQDRYFPAGNRPGATDYASCDRSARKGDTVTTGIRQKIYFVLLVFALPLAGWLAGLALTSYAQDNYQGRVLYEPAAQAAYASGANVETIDDACASAAFRAATHGYCGGYEMTAWFRDIAAWALFGAAGLLLIVALSGRLLRNSPALLAIAFGIEIRVVCLFLGYLTLVQGVIFLLFLALLASASLHQVPVQLFGFLGFAILAGGVLMVRVAFRMVRKFRSRAFASEITRDMQPRLWAFIDAIATKLGAAPPRNLLLGFESAFFVTAADIELMPSRKLLTGETMYLSLPMLRLLSATEFAAVVGHELGHFKGRDTLYSLRFLPIYYGIWASIASIRARRGVLDGIALRPALAVLTFCQSEFAKAERTISRTRELAADAAGASAGGGGALVASLIKLAAFGPAWETVVDRYIESIDAGQPLQNLSLAFEQEARRRRAEAEPGALIAGVMASHQPHPTDTHPTLAARAAALQVTRFDDAMMLDLDGEMSVALINQPALLESDMSRMMEQVYGSADRTAPPPETTDEAATVSPVPV
jgi:Zn-dependent protease with chaperone function